MIVQTIQTLTSQIIATLLYSPYNVILLLIQCQIELENDGKIDHGLSIYQLCLDFITKRGLLSLWSGVSYYYFTNVSVQLSNIFITWLFELQNINKEEPILKRYSIFITAVSFKTLFMWILGFWMYFAWMWNITDFCIKNKKEHNKQNKNLSKFKKSFNTFKSIINEMKNNPKLILFLFILSMLQALTYLTIEFTSDWLYVKIIPQSINPTIRSMILRSMINLTCSVATWPFHTIIKNITVGQRYRNNNNKKSMQITDIWRKFQKSNGCRFYRAYLFAVSVQIISIGFNLTVNMLKIQKTK
ncbi:hypothetical protein C6P42_000744 [Pichia californica]|nr:hypothetical protein C6P42_000744 [[Candida] californica]